VDRAGKGLRGDVGMSATQLKLLRSEEEEEKHL